jgi:heme-degrading monooxygenase HmoA
VWRDTVARDEEVLVIAVVWQFDVREGKEDEFERFYGADGAWTAISRRSRSFLGSSFLKDLAQPERYVVVEYWSEMLVYERHHADFADEVVELEQQRDALVSLMRPLGLFNALNVPDRSGPTWSQRTGRD